MRMKRILTILLAGAMVLSLAACGQTQKESVESKQKESSSLVQESKKEEQSSEKPKEVPTLTYLVPGDKLQDMDSVLEKMNEILVEEIGAKIDIQFIDTSAFAERMKMNMASGLDYDLCFTGYCNKYITAVENEALLDLTDYIENDPEFKAALPDYAWNAATIDGRIYGVPNLQNYARETALVVDKEMAEKYGLDAEAVTCMDDLEPFLEAVKAGNEKNFFIYRNNYGAQMWGLGGSSGDGFTTIYKDESGKVVAAARQDMPQYQYAIQRIHDWYKAGYIRTDILSAGDDSAEWNAGKYIVGEISYKPGDEATIAQKRGREVVVVHYNTPTLISSEPLATLTSVGIDSKYPDEAAAFIKEINTNTELYNLLCYGIEGKHYNLNAEGKVVKIADSGYNPNGNWKFGNTYNALLLEGQTEEQMKISLEMNLTAKVGLLDGFTFDKSAVETEVANVSAVVEEYKYSEDGAVAPEEYMDEFVKKLKDAGQDKIIAEYQRQLDEFFGQ